MRYFPAIFPWANPPYPPIPQERKTFADYWDAIFGRRLTFYRVEMDGSWFIGSKDEADEFRSDHSIEDWDYTITEVHMTQRQFDALPEFQGF